MWIPGNSSRGLADPADRVLGQIRQLRMNPLPNQVPADPKPRPSFSPDTRVVDQDIELGSIQTARVELCPEVQPHPRPGWDRGRSFLLVVLLVLCGIHIPMYPRPADTKPADYIRTGPHHSHFMSQERRHNLQQSPRPRVVDGESHIGERRALISPISPIPLSPTQGLLWRSSWLESPHQAVPDSVRWA